MAVYAIGDLQGCHAEFMALLERLRFDPRRDRLWLTGDLVNRGPASLAALREVKALGRAATVVLGNHDLHLLAMAFAPKTTKRREPELEAVLDAPDAAELLDWLAARPLLHRDDALGWTLYANGRYEEALRYADEANALGYRNALFRFHRGMIEAALGHDAEARTSLEEALRINPYFSIRWAPVAQETLASLGAAA